MANFTPSFDNYTNVKPFKFWVQTVIPLVYDESLSYVELLAKVVDFLNKLIEDNKAMIHNIDELKEYVYSKIGDGSMQDYVNEWLDEHPEATTTVQDRSLSLSKFTDMLVMQTLNNYVTPQMYGAIADGTTDDSEAINSALLSGFDVYFPEGSYKFKNVEIHNKRINIKIHKNAVLEGDLTDNHMLKFINCEIDINGGLWTRGDGTTNLIGTLRSSGILYFNNCKKVSVSNATFNNVTVGTGIYILDSENIKVDNCNFNHTLQAGVALMNGCKNIEIVNCDFKDALLPTNVSDTWWTYTICTGFTQYTTPVGYIENLLIHGCSFENCEWEGIDCHGGNNIEISNCIIHNAKTRFITVYPDSRPNIPDVKEFYNVLIKNCYCYNDEDYVMIESDGCGIYTRGSVNRRYRNYKIENCKLVNSPRHTEGIIRTRYIRDMVIDNVDIEYTYDKVVSMPAFRPYQNYNIVLSNITLNNVFTGLGYIIPQMSTGQIRNIVAYGKLKQTYAMVYDAGFSYFDISHITSQYGRIYYTEPRYRLVGNGDLIYDYPNHKYRGYQSMSRGLVLEVENKPVFNFTKVSNNMIELSGAVNVARYVPGMLVDLVDGSTVVQGKIVNLEGDNNTIEIDVDLSSITSGEIRYADINVAKLWTTDDYTYPIFGDPM